MKTLSKAYDAMINKEEALEKKLSRLDPNDKPEEYSETLEKLEAIKKYLPMITELNMELYWID